MAKTNTTSISPDAVVNQSEMSNLESMMRRFVFGIKSEINVCIPAVVQSYDRGAKKAVVIPLIKLKYIKDGSEEHIVHGELNVRVRQICLGGFSIDIPLYAGETGWVISSDVDTSVLRQYGNSVCQVLDKDVEQKTIQDELPQIPGTNYVHIFENGFFIPDCWAAFDPSVIKAGGAKVGEESLYIGESISNTCSVDKDGKSSAGSDQDGLASISIKRRSNDSKGSLILSVGEKCYITVGGKDDGKIKMSVSDNCSIELDGEKVSIDAPALELPEMTTVGGKTFSEQAFNS